MSLPPLTKHTHAQSQLPPANAVPHFTAAQEAQIQEMVKKVGGIKFDQGKAPMSLLSREALEQTALVLEFGRKKYAAHNWRNGFDWSRPLSAAMRHLMAFNDGEDKDPESGLSHLAHAAACIMFVLEFEKTHPGLDDRYKHNK